MPFVRPAVRHDMSSELDYLRWSDAGDSRSLSGITKEGSDPARELKRPRVQRLGGKHALRHRFWQAADLAKLFDAKARWFLPAFLMAKGGHSEPPCKRFEQNGLRSLAGARHLPLLEP